MTQQKPKSCYSNPRSSPTQPQQTSVFSTMRSIMIQGFGFGVGSSIARNTIDRIFPSQSSSSFNCEQLWKNYLKCIESNSTVCDTILNDFHVCTSKSNSSSS